MNWLKQRKQSEEVSYWQTIADALAALLMIVLLILMMLVLYIVRIPDNDFVDNFEGDRYNGYLDPDAGAGAHGNQDFNTGKAQYWEEGDQDGSRGSDVVIHVSGGGSGGTPTEPTEETRGETEGEDKAAVYVMVLDSETERTIKKAGIRFELYDNHEMLQILNSYYPKKIEYRNFDTTADGVFYLPEKLSKGSYSLHELTTPPGYDAADNLNITVAEAYDWPEPLVARIMLSPSKNVIRIQMNDRVSGEALSGGSYDVFAAEDIMTMDGTLRYPINTLVCTIECDRSGYGESEGLYLGKYYLQEHTVPQYYSRDMEQTKVSVEKKSSSLTTAARELTNARTTVVLTVTDELYGNVFLPDVAFSFAQEGGAQRQQTLYTDDYGQIRLTQLNKGVSYVLRQIGTMDGYSLNLEPVRFHVDEDGRVEEEAYFELTVSNRTLRAAISVKGALLQNLVADYNVSLYNGEGEMVAIWDSTGMAHIVEGLQPGDYYIRINGQEKTQKHILIRDEKDIQRFGYSVWATADIGAAAMLGVFAAGLIAVLPFIIRRRARKKNEEQMQEVS